jgi:GNAT superfamily N-acetyltransferase
MKSSKVFSIDFDGTLVEHDYPRVGDPLPGAFEVLKELQAAGHKLILWTCREDQGYNISRQFLREAVEFCRSQGIEFDSVNEALHEHDFRDKGPRRKPYAHYYIDDAIIGGFPGWDKIRQFLVAEGVLS